MAHASAVQLQQSLENEATRRQLEQPVDTELHVNGYTISDDYIAGEYSNEQYNRQSGVELDCEPGSVLEKQVSPLMPI